MLSRGRVIVEGEQWLGSAGHGRFLRREPRGFAQETRMKLEARPATLVG